MTVCKCGCGETVKRGRTFINKKHQLEWMSKGGARELNALQPIEAKSRGGVTAGQEAFTTGRLQDASVKGGARSHEIAEAFRTKTHREAPKS